VKNLLVELDIDNSGEVSEQNLEDSLNIMKALKQGLDVDGSGGVNKQELEAGVQLLTKLAKDRAANTTELDYKHMPECIQGVMKEWDADGSGKVSVGELAAAAAAFKKIQQEGRLMKKIILGLVVVILILLVGMFVLSMAAAEMAKESHVEGGRQTDLNGNVIATRSSDFEVCADGTMASWGKCPAPGTSRRLEESAGDMLKTVPTKQRQALSSSMADSFFMALDEVAVFSDKGHTLRLAIHGFARVPVLNSRCGNIVHLYTAWNGRVTLDSVDLSFDAETATAFANAGFSLITGGVSGRRLAEGHGVDGFFSAVQGVQAAGWTCQGVPLPTLPSTYSQHMTVYRPCAVQGVTGSRVDMCDSRYGGVVPGIGKLPQQHQLATSSKTERIRAHLSVKVPIESTLFTTLEIETLKSPSFELQVSKMGNHPGQQKVYFFDRRTAEDIDFQLIESQLGDGRFYCNSSGSSEETAQKKELEGEKQGIQRKVHFEFLDMIEEDGRLLRHFRMMPAEAFLDWMGAKPASERPTDAYYEYWDVADSLTPFRLLNPDGSVVVLAMGAGGISDADVEARLEELGASKWSARTKCTADEKEIEEVMAPSLGMRVPVMSSPMMDLTYVDLAFYARVHLDDHVEDAGGNGWQSMVKRSQGSGPLAAFALYAVSASDPIAVYDVCADACASSLAALRAEMQAGSSVELCDAQALTRAIQCMVDVAGARSALCMKTNFMSTVNNDCLQAASDRRLSEDQEDDESLAPSSGESDAELQGSDVYLQRLGRLERGSGSKPGGHARKLGETKQSQMKKLSDGTTVIDLDSFDAAQRAKIAEALGVQQLAGGRVLFNATDSEPRQKLTAVLEASEEPGSVHSRRLMLDVNCQQIGVGPGCIFKISYPWHCDPIDGEPRCDFGIAVKIQIGGPLHGALIVSGTGCVPEWTFGVPPPFDGSLCIDGGITVSWSGACGLPFSLSGVVGLTAQVGLDLWIFSFSFASIRVEAGASVTNYRWDCKEPERRRDWWSGRRRGDDMTCQLNCDIKVYAKATFQVFVARVWAEVRYWVFNQDFDFIIGADFYIWAAWWGWWETLAQVQIA